MAKISVIVPVYNGAQTLLNAVKCLLTQTFSDLEIILVDDGSTDGSIDIEKALADKFPGKVKFVQPPCHGGAGGARNHGLAVASGDYIGFMDCDDLIVPQMYEMLYDAITSSDADIADSGYYYEEKDLAIIHTSDELCGKLDAPKRMELIVSGGYIVTKLFKHSFLTQHHFVFRENAILEDSEYLTRAFALADSIVNVKEIFYKYCYYPSSSSKVADSVKYCTNIYNAMVAIRDTVMSLPNYESIRPAVEYEMLQMYSYGCVMTASALKSGENDDVTNLFSKMRQLRLESVTLGYSNKYIHAKMDSADIELMTLADMGLSALLKAIR